LTEIIFYFILFEIEYTPLKIGSPLNAAIDKMVQVIRSNIRRRIQSYITPNRGGMEMKELQQIEQLFSKGLITRREFINKVSAIGLSAALSPMILKSTAQAATPKRGGRFRVAIVGGSANETLAPDKVTSPFSGGITWGQLRNCLVEIDQDNLPQPELAVNWECSKDAKTWYFDLRKNVEFHNGKTMDADDVVFSYNIHRGEKSKSPSKGYLKPVTDIRADGKYRVIFQLESPNVDFPYIASDYCYQIIPNGTTDFDNAPGTGGYILSDYEPGVRAFTKRNPNYWKKDRAWFDEIETLGIADPVAKINALVTNEVDYAFNVDMKLYDRLIEKSGIQGIETLGFMHLVFTMRTDIPPFNNNDARLAMKYALDRDLVLKQVLRGHGEVGNDHPISPVFPNYNSDLEQRKYDPDKARYHFKKAGLEGSPIDIYVSEAGFAGSVDTASIYAENAKKAGIKLNIVRAPVDGYWSDTWGKKPFSACYWGGRPTEEGIFSQSWIGGENWDVTKWENARFRELLSQYRAELDKNNRRDILWELQQIARDEAGKVVLAFPPFLDAASDKVQHGKVAPNWYMDGGHAFERWWFKS
jgi:peptide/nickel transport system substrate-binding protein